MFRPTAIVLALAACASAIMESSYEAGLLPSIVSSMECSFENPVQSLLQNRFLFSVDRLKEAVPPQSQDEEEEDDAAHERHANLASAIVAHPGMTDAFLGFDNGAFESWKQAGVQDIPAEYDGVADLSAYTYHRINGDGHMEKYFANKDFHRIDPAFEIDLEEYDLTQRPWYQAAKAADVGAWTSPYTDFYNDRQLISSTVNLKDSEGKKLGVVGFSFDVSNLQEMLQEKLEDMPEGTLVFIMDASDDHLLVTASVPGSAYDAEGHQIPALDSPSAAIAATTQALLDHKASGGDPSEVFVSTDHEGNKWFNQVREIDHLGMLPFSDGRSCMVVSTQPATCEEGYELDEERAGCVCGSSPQ